MNLIVLAAPSLPHLHARLIILITVKVIKVTVRFSVDDDVAVIMNNLDTTVFILLQTISSVSEDHCGCVAIRLSTAQDGVHGGEHWTLVLG